LSFIFNNSYSNWTGVIFPNGFIFIFLMISDVQYFFMCMFFIISILCKLPNLRYSIVAAKNGWRQYVILNIFPNAYLLISISLFGEEFVHVFCPFVD
jgi:hypothetical protein